MYNEIGERIKLLRISKKLTQEELAQALNVKRETVARWETGTRDIKTEITISLSKFFNVSADYLLGLSEYKNEKSENIGAVTGLSDNNISWLADLVTIGNEYIDNSPSISFTDMLNKILNSIKENDVLSKLILAKIHLFLSSKSYEEIKKANLTSDNVIDIIISREKYIKCKNELINIFKQIIDDITNYSNIKDDYDNICSKWLERYLS